MVFFDEEDERDRVERALKGAEKISDPVRLAGALMSRLARSQALTEGNKRTALAGTHFVLVANGFDPQAYLLLTGSQVKGPPDMSPSSGQLINFLGTGRTQQEGFRCICQATRLLCTKRLEQFWRIFYRI